jgi:hypothetical protein
MRSLKTLWSPIIAVVAILAGGFILFNLAFVLYALLVTLPKLLAGETVEWVGSTLPVFLGTIGLSILIGLAVWFLVEKKLRQHTINATLLTVPLMAILVFLGIGLYGQSDLVIAVAGAAVIVPILGFCIWKKVPWVYTLAVVYVGILGIVMMLFDVQI